MAIMYDRWTPLVSLHGVSAGSYMIIFKFLCKHLTIGNNLLQFHWLGISDADLQDLKTAVPELWEFSIQDLSSAGKLFSLIKSPPVLTQLQKNACDALVREIDPDNGGNLDMILRNYYSAASYPSPPPALCEQLQNYCKISEELFKFIIKKTIAGVQLLNNFVKLRQQCDLLAPCVTALRLGDKDLVECQKIGKKAINFRSAVKDQLSVWFEIQLPYIKATTAENTQLLSSYLQGASYDADLTLRNLNEWKRGNQLHLKFSSFVPISSDSWDDVGVCSNEVDSFFETISSFTMSPSAIAAQKLPNKKKEVANLREKIIPLIGEPDDDFKMDHNNDPEQIAVLITDAEHLFQELMKMAEHGIEFITSNMGVNRDEFSRWRVELLKLQKLVKMEQEVKKKDASSLKDLHAKNVKPRFLPKITSLETYSQFYFIWSNEAENYPSEVLKINAIRGCISDPVDKANTMALNS